MITQRVLFAFLEKRRMDYVLWLLEYYIRNKGLVVKEMNEGGIMEPWK